MTPHILDVPLLAAGEPTPSPGGRVLDLARRPLDLRRRVAVMGIVNRTPDSFYDGGETAALDAAVARAHDHVEAGADIVDVGGVPGGGGEPVSVDEEIARVVPVIQAVRARDGRVLLSVDTYRAAVAAAALEAGADLVNDVSGGHDPEILDVVATHAAGYVAVHHGGQPRTEPFRPGYRPEVTSAVVAHLHALTERAEEAGVEPERLVVDPGHDFHKTTHHSLQLCRDLPAVAALGYPVLVALSNKDFVGETLGRGLHERVEGSLAAAVFSVLRGASLVRVHQVAETAAALRMVESLLGWRQPSVTVRGLE